jgi:VWFA-related protein
LASVALIGQQARFTTESAGVVFDVAVVHNGQFVPGLTTEDFEVTDRGVKQRISVTETQDSPLDVVVVLQPLASLRREGAVLAEAGAREVFRLMEPTDRVAMLVASAPPALARPLDTLASLADQIPVSNVRGTEDVALWDSLFLSYRQFDRPDRRKVVFAFTNSDHDAGVTGPRDIARSAELRPAQLFFLIVDKTGPDPWAATGAVRSQGGRAVASTDYFTTAVNWSVPPALFDLAEATGGEVIDVRNGPANVARLLTYLRAEYVITFVPEGVPAGGWHDVSISLKGHRGTVVARPGYWVPERQAGH